MKTFIISRGPKAEVRPSRSDLWLFDCCGRDEEGRSGRKLLGHEPVSRRKGGTKAVKKT